MSAQTDNSDSGRILLVSRHPGALAWARAKKLVYDQHLEHIDPETIQPGDIVIGTLPINLAARICQHGGRYLHLSLNLPRQARGRELSAAELRAYGAHLEEFIIHSLGQAQLPQRDSNA